MNTPIVIIGGGHAAAPLCAALAEAGLGAQVHLVCGEPVLPYQRPPLSKAYLKNPAETPQAHRADAWYAQAGITVHRADPATAIDWDAPEPAANDAPVEDAIVQVMTFLVENEEAALVRDLA